VLALRRAANGKWLIAARLGEDFRPPDTTPRPAERLVAQLDAAQIKRAAVLSPAYWFGDPTLRVEDEYAKVRAENDWVAREIAKYPDRLFGFCGVNPLKPYSTGEIDRCASQLNLKGVKLHFANSRVDLLNSQHMEAIRKIFQQANNLRIPVLAHLGNGQSYGPRQSEVFLEQIVPAAPDIAIQIAHLASDLDALDVYAKAATGGDPRMKNLYFDVGDVIERTTPPETLTRVASLLRAVGLQRVLFASDFFPGGTNPAPLPAWQAFMRLPLDEEEFRVIAGNIAPYLR